MKKKVEAGKKIWKAYKNYRFKKEVFIKLRLLASRIRLWKKLAAKFAIDIQRKKFIIIKEFAKKKIQEEKERKNKALAEARNKRQMEDKVAKDKKTQEVKKQMPSVFMKIAKISTFGFYRNFLTQLKALPDKKNEKLPKMVDKKDNLKVAPKKNVIAEEMNNTLLNESIVEDTNERY